MDRSDRSPLQPVHTDRVDVDDRAGTVPNLESWRIGDVTFEPSARRFTLHTRELPLTTMEYDVLASLVRAAGQVVPRDALMAAVFGRDASPLDRALDVHISHLRRKLGRHRDLILTIRGVGYMFRASGPRRQRG